MTIDRLYTDVQMFSDLDNLRQYQNYFSEGLAEGRSQFYYFFRYIAADGELSAGNALLDVL